MGRVAEVSPSISSACSVDINSSKFDVIAIGADGKFMEYSNVKMAYGSMLPRRQVKINLNDRLNHETDLDKIAQLINNAQVAGVSTLSATLIKIGDLVENGDSYNKIVRFRVDDLVYVQVRARPTLSSAIIGYVKGNILESYEAREYWGGPYESVSAVGRAYQNPDGNRFGRWIRAKVPLYEEKLSTVYTSKLDNSGARVIVDGYLTENNLQILSKEQIKLEKYLENVLGESTLSVNVSTESARSLLSIEFKQSHAITGSASVSASDKEEELEKSILAQTQSAQKEKTMTYANIEVKSDTKKQAVITSALANIVSKKPHHKLLNSKIRLEYIVSGNNVVGMSGRFITKPVEYEIIGITKEDRLLMLFTPIEDLESVGVKKVFFS